jgi:hypothetical protein
LTRIFKAQADLRSSFAILIMPILMHVFSQSRICPCCAQTLFGALGWHWRAIRNRRKIWSGIRIGERMSEWRAAICLG